MTFTIEPNTEEKLVPGEGPLTATWAVVGEAPGAAEERQLRPFVGPSGMLLREALARVGLEPAEGYITNVVKVRPPNNATPGAAALRKALPALVSELQQLPNLRAILLVGNSPLKAMTPETSITKSRGTVKSLRPEAQGLGAVSVFATLHPAAVLRIRDYYNGWLQDLSAFKQLVDPPVSQDEIILVDNPLTWEVFRLSVAPVGALDIETTIPEGGVAELVSVAVTFDGFRAFVFRSDNYLWRKAKYLLQPLKWIMHNGYFDTLHMRRFGMDLRMEHDTMAMAYLLHEDERKGLEILSSVHLSEPPYKGVDYHHILEEPFEKVAEMNGKDANRTFRLFRPLADELNKNPRLSRLYQWLLLPAVRTLVRVTENGVPVDRERLAELTTLETKEVEQLRAYLQDEVKSPDFNPNSPLQVGNLLYEQWGLPVLASTATGAPSTAADVLARLLPVAGEHGNWVAALVQYRERSKLLSSYLTSWPGLIDQDNKMHPRYKPLHVVTGRLSSEGPNIQNVPRSAEYRKVFRDPEWVWLKADYSQIELRVAAWLSGEPQMLEAYRTGQDLHSLTAQLVLHSDPKAMYKGTTARQAAKTMNFGLLYGAGPGTLQRVARMEYGLVLTDDEARQARDDFFYAYPGLRAWHNRVEAGVTSTGMSVSPLGRVRHLAAATRPKWDDEDGARHKAIREGINHPVQSFASDLLLMALVRVQAMLDDLGEPVAHIVAEVHDEMDLLVRPDSVHRVAAQVKEIMEDVSWLQKFGIKLSIPVLAEVTAGPSWGEQETL